MRPLIPMLSMLILWMAASASALEPRQVAERNRLRDEMAELASRGAWRGVDRQYLKLVEEGLEPAISDHLQGARAAIHLGEMSLGVERLERAVAERPAQTEGPEATAWDEARSTLDGILARYGKVEIKVKGGRLPGLVRFDLPFGTEERETIQHAREVILEKGEYRGLLPIGGYMIDGDKFEVVRSEQWQVVVVD